MGWLKGTAHMEAPSKHKRMPDYLPQNILLCHTYGNADISRVTIAELDLLLLLLLLLSLWQEFIIEF